MFEFGNFSKLELNAFVSLCKFYSPDLLIEGKQNNRLVLVYLRVLNLPFSGECFNSQICKLYKCIPQKCTLRCVACQRLIAYPAHWGLQILCLCSLSWGAPGSVPCSRAHREPTEAGISCLLSLLFSHWSQDVFFKNILLLCAYFGQQWFLRLELL